MKRKTPKVEGVPDHIWVGETFPIAEKIIGYCEAECWVFDEDFDDLKILLRCAEDARYQKPGGKKLCAMHAMVEESRR